jgi:hypothetical protein
VGNTRPVKGLLFVVGQKFAVLLWTAIKLTARVLYNLKENKY